MMETKLTDLEFHGVRFIAESRTKITINRSEEIVFKMESNDSNPLSLDKLTKIREDLIVYKANFTTLLAFYYGNGLFEFDFDHFSQNKLMVTKMVLESECEEDLSVICESLKNDFIDNSYICDVTKYLNNDINCERLYISTESVVYSTETDDNLISKISNNFAKITIPDYGIFDANMQVISIKSKRDYADVKEILACFVDDCVFTNSHEIKDENRNAYILKSVFSVMHLDYFKISSSELIFIIIYRPDKYLLISDKDDDTPLLLCKVFINDKNTISLYESENMSNFVSGVFSIEIDIDFNSGFDIREKGGYFIYEIIECFMLSIPNFVMTCFKNDFWPCTDTDPNDFGGCIVLDRGEPCFLLIPLGCDFDTINYESEEQISMEIFFKPIVINPIPVRSICKTSTDDCDISYIRILTSKRFNEIICNINKRFFADTDPNNPPIFIHDPNDNSSETGIKHFLQMTQKGNIEFFYSAPGQLGLNYKFINKLLENGYSYYNLRDMGDLIIKPDDRNKLIDIPI